MFYFYLIQLIPQLFRGVLFFTGIGRKRDLIHFFFIYFFFYDLSPTSLIAVESRWESASCGP